jgi:hypothetical protein
MKHRRNGSKSEPAYTQADFDEIYHEEYESLKKLGFSHQFAKKRAERVVNSIRRAAEDLADLQIAQ